MNKRDLVEEVAGRTGLPAGTVAAVLDAAVEAIRAAVVRGERVVLSGFGAFHRQARAARTARDLRTGRAVRVPARHVPAFRPGRAFAEAVARAGGIRRRSGSRGTPRQGGRGPAAS